MLQLRRITSTGRYLAEIDGLRFAAIASVVLYHFCGFERVHFAATDHGYRGVNIFYVISGFVLGLPFAMERLADGAAVSLPRYFLRRLTRLEPPYILNLLISFAIAPAAALLPHLAASLAYVHNFVYAEHSPINPVAWTLEVEVQFYCAAPLLALIYLIRSKLARRFILSAAILVAGVLQILNWNAPQRVQLSLAFAIQFFLAGLLLADLFATGPQSRSFVWDLVSLAGWPLVFLPADKTIWIALPFLIFLLQLATFRGVLFRRIFTMPAITIVGGMCYSIYLFHYVLIPPYLRVFGHVAGFAVQLLIYSAALLLVAGAYFVLIERPCMRKDWPAALIRRIGLAPRATPVQ